MARRKTRPARWTLWDLVRRVVDVQGSPEWEGFLHGETTTPPPVTQQRAWFRFEPAGVGFPVYLTFGRGENGRLVCTGLMAGLESSDTAITSSDLRSLSIPEMTQSVSGRDEWTREILGDPERTAPRYRSHRRGHPGRRGYPIEHYEEVLAAYEWAVRHHPAAPVQALRTKLRHLQRPPSREPVPEPTIYRWLSTARKRVNEEKS